MIERENPISDPDEGRENSNDIDQFITDLFPQIFESLMGITSFRNGLLSKVHILSQETSHLMLHANISDGNDEYNIFYGAIGKKDRAFEMRKNPITYQNKTTFESLFCLTDSEEGFFEDLADNSNKNISTTKRRGNIVITDSNDAEACMAGVDTLELLKSLKDSTVTFLDE
jgi:hypothetical protein